MMSLTSAFANENAVGYTHALTVTTNLNPAQALSPNSCDTTIYIDMDVCAGTVLTIGGQTVYYSGVYTDSLTTAGGCDSIVVYTLTYRAQYFYFTNDSICQGDSMYLNNAWRYSPGVYYDTLSSIFGCDSIRGVNLTYKSSALVSNTVYICPGESVFVGGANQTTPGLYYDTVYSSVVCDSFIVTEVIEFMAPQVDAISSSSQICNGDSVSLSASIAGTLVWSTGQSGVFTDSPTTATTYFVTATDLDGCVSTDSVDVNVTPLPTLTIASLQPICVGVPAQLNATSNGVVTWDVSGNNPVSVYPAITTDYTATAVDANGCTSTSQITVDVLSKAWLNVVVSQSEYCEGDSSEITVSASGNVVWNTGETGSITVNPTTSTNYQAIVVNNDGCSDSTDVGITVHSIPSIHAGMDSELCIGQTVSLYGTGNGTITWGQGLPNNSSVTPSTTKKYVAHIEDVNSCMNTDTVEITVNELPNVSIDPFTISQVTNNDDPIDVPAAFPNGGDYFGNGVIDRKFFPNIAGPGEHQVYYVFTDAHGCEDQDFTNISVSLYNGVEDNEFTGTISMYPNPAKNNLFIDLQLGALEIVSYKMMSISGEIVQRGELNDMVVNNLDINSLAQGVYLIQLQHENKVTVLRFVKN